MEIQASPTTAAEAAAAVSDATDRAEALGLLTRPRERPFEIVEFEGKRYAIVAPSAGERSAILNGAVVFTVTADGKPSLQRTDHVRMQALGLIHMLHTVARVPGAEGAEPTLKPGVKVFDPGHVDEVLNLPAGALAESLGDRCIGFMNKQITKAEAAAKK